MYILFKLIKKVKSILNEEPVMRVKSILSEEEE